MADRLPTSPPDRRRDVPAVLIVAVTSATALAVAGVLAAGAVRDSKAPTGVTAITANAGERAGSTNPPGTSGTPASTASPSATATATGRMGAPSPAGARPVADTTGAPGGSDTPASVDWANADITIPPNVTGCASGTARFRSGTALVGGSPYRMGHQVSGVQREQAVRTVDITGDGVLDAVLTIDCLAAEVENPPHLLLVVAGGPRPSTLAMLACVRPREFDGNGDSDLRSIALDGRTIRWISQTWEGNGGGTFEARWTGTSFAITARP